MRRSARVARFNRSGRGLKPDAGREKQSDAVARFNRSGRGLKPNVVASGTIYQSRPLQSKRARIETLRNLRASRVISVALFNRSGRGLKPLIPVVGSELWVVARFNRSGRGLKPYHERDRRWTCSRPLQSKRARIETRTSSTPRVCPAVARFNRSGRGLKPLKSAGSMPCLRRPLQSKRARIETCKCAG